MSKASAGIKTNRKGKGGVATNKKSNSPRSLIIGQEGIDTGTQFARFMSALMTDVIEGSVPPGTCNAACNAGGKLLRIVEMQIKYGSPNGSGNTKDLILSGQAQLISQ